MNSPKMARARAHGATAAARRRRPRPHHPRAWRRRGAARLDAVEAIPEVAAVGPKVAAASARSRPPSSPSSPPPGPPSPPPSPPSPPPRSRAPQSRRRGGGRRKAAKPQSRRRGAGRRKAAAAATAAAAAEAAAFGLGDSEAPQDVRGGVAGVERGVHVHVGCAVARAACIELREPSAASRRSQSARSACAHQAPRRGHCAAPRRRREAAASTARSPRRRCVNTDEARGLESTGSLDTSSAIQYSTMSARHDETSEKPLTHAGMESERSKRSGSARASLATKPRFLSEIGDDVSE
jgi:hypothetical protein